MEIHIYTDGGCLGNPGPGGWAYMIMRDRNQRAAVYASGRHPPSFPVPYPPEVLAERWGASKDTTNNRMELCAAVAALEMLCKLKISPQTVVLFTDSQYVQKGMSEWIEGWKRNGWRNADKAPVKNQDLWQRLDDLASRFNIRWEWVKGHDGNEYNERCDKLAQKAIANLRL